MARRRAKVVVLCEDLAHWDFARRSLIRLGWKARDFSPRICPSGSQSGEQFVRQKYPEEVRGQRSRQDVKLLAVTDADTHTLSRREQQLAQSLKRAGGSPRKKGERIAIWIPRRNLETWVYLYTHPDPVDERCDYKPKVDEHERAAAAQSFGDDLKRRSIAPRRCPSLGAALVETDRLRR